MYSSYFYTGGLDTIKIFSKKIQNVTYIMTSGLADQGATRTQLTSMTQETHTVESTCT